MTTTPTSTNTLSVFETARDTEGLIAPASQLPFQIQRPEALIDISIDPSQRFQPIIGFGGALTESSAINYQLMTPDNRETFLKHYFSSTEGHGYTLCRTHIHACDFSRGHYTYVDDGDTSLNSFSLDADRQTLLPFIHDAIAASDRPIAFLASPWSPPPWMKTTGRMVRGGKLLPEHRQTWADYYVRYINAMRDEGIDIWGVTVQNEPDAEQTWESCIYTAEEERDFVRDHLGPTLEKAGLGDIKIIIWDHNRDRLFDRASVVYDDPEASRYTWGAGFHWYCGDFFENLTRTHDAYPDKHLIFTEGCQEGGPHVGSWATGERYARSIINDLNRWTEGWIDWNLLLDETGGPNHVNNLCSAPILYDRPAGVMKLQSSYHYLGHFSRFIQPGATRIGCDVSHADLPATAVENPDGSLAVVILNTGEYALSYRLELDGRFAAGSVPAHGIQTLTTPAS
ncbi:MAG: glycoside hydrolase family 30 protein [Phycisphaeraceae bacterium]